VPAKVAGTWRLPQGLLTLAQKYQKLTGTLWSGGTRTLITNGRLRGNQIRFTVGGALYTGRVNGDTMSGDVKVGAMGAWTASRLPRSLNRD
jgi:hypothetical protein